MILVSGFRVEILGFQRSGFRIQGVGWRVEDVGVGIRV